jgi:hypothetical protein
MHAVREPVHRELDLGSLVLHESSRLGNDILAFRLGNLEGGFLRAEEVGRTGGAIEGDIRFKGEE